MRIVCKMIALNGGAVHTWNPDVEISDTLAVIRAPE